jgi:hypothetical protein
LSLLGRADQRSGALRIMETGEAAVGELTRRLRPYYADSDPLIAADATATRPANAASP